MHVATPTAESVGRQNKAKGVTTTKFKEKYLKPGAGIKYKGGYCELFLNCEFGMFLR